MALVDEFLAETNFVVGRMLEEYNNFGDPKDVDSRVKWGKVSLGLSVFVEEVKTDERIPKIVGAPIISDLHKAYMTDKNVLYMHEINMHLMTMFDASKYVEMANTLGRAYHASMRCNTVDGKSEIDEQAAINIFRNNPWLIGLYMVRMNYFTAIALTIEGNKPNET